MTAFLLVGLAWPAAAQDVNRVVIQVNDRIATLYDYESRLEDFQQEIAANSDMPLAERRRRIAGLPKEVFANLLEEQLLLSRADQLGIVFTEEEVDEQLSRMRQGYGFDSDEAFAQVLSQSGTSLRKFREQLRTQMRIRELIGREVRSEVDVDEELARIYYRDHPEQFMTPRRLRLRELVVLDDSDLTADERQKLAESLRQEIAAGRAVEDMVAEHAEKGETSNLIDIGWVGGGDLAPELQEAVWDLGVDEVSPPVESRGGLHVLQVLERQEEGQKPFNDVIDEAKNRAANQALAEKMESYMDKLENESYVRLEPPPAAEGFRAASGQEPPAPNIPRGEAPSSNGTSDESMSPEPPMAAEPMADDASSTESPPLP